MKIRNEKWIQLQAYPIKLENNHFPSGQDQAEGFAVTIGANFTSFSTVL